MAGYRRFIAYVYEYRKGKKNGNCGFIKVEVREERCSIEVHLHCEGITPQTECKVFGFVRKDGLINGILLGSCETQDDVVECLIETDSTNMAESGVALGKTGGMIFLTESGGFFGTEWDDQPIRPDNFKELPVSELPGELVEKQRDFSREGADKTEKVPGENEGCNIEQQDGGNQEKAGSEENGKENDRKNDKKYDKEYVGPGNKETDRDHVEYGSKEESGDFIEAIEKSEGYEEFKSTEEQAESGNVEIEEYFTDIRNHVGREKEIPGEDKLNSEKTEKVCKENDEENHTESSDKMNNQEAASAGCAKASYLLASGPQTAPLNDIKEDHSTSPGPQIQKQSIEKNHNLSSPGLSGQKHNPAQFRRLPFGEEFMPFDDGEFLRSWKIRPDDLRYFPMRNRGLHNNRFIQHGYYNFGHILLAHKSGGQFILGVPGGYDQQERFMANMFGFPWFKASREIELPKNKGGYWYRLIDAPNLN